MANPMIMSKNLIIIPLLPLLVLIGLIMEIFNFELRKKYYTSMQNLKADPMLIVSGHENFMMHQLLIALIEWKTIKKNHY